MKKMTEYVKLRRLEELAQELDYLDIIITLEDDEEIPELYHYFKYSGMTDAEIYKAYWKEYKRQAEKYIKQG
jgi:microsomal dipeptidase-like Zn-dependent dipeptidase